MLLLITLLQQIIHKFDALTLNLSIKSIYASGADPGFPVGGGANPPVDGANIQIFPKTTWN